MLETGTVPALISARRKLRSGTGSTEQLSHKVQLCFKDNALVSFVETLQVVIEADGNNLKEQGTHDEDNPFLDA